MQRLQKKPGNLKSGGSNTNANHFNFGPDLIGLRNTLILNVWFHIMKCYLSFWGKAASAQRWRKNDHVRINTGPGIAALIGHALITVVCECVCVSACVYGCAGRSHSAV